MSDALRHVDRELPEAQRLTDGQRHAVGPVVDLLAEPAGNGRAPVHGIELSEAMVAGSRAKPGGEDAGVTLGCCVSVWQRPASAAGPAPTP